eukprot:2956933-Prymnesium_polylepis.1
MMVGRPGHARGNARPGARRALRRSGEREAKACAGGASRERARGRGVRTLREGHQRSTSRCQLEMVDLGTITMCG